MTERPQPPKKRRRFLVVLAFLSVVLVGAWYAIERYVLDIDRYRDMLVEEIERATGLAAGIGELDLVLFPMPHVVGYDVWVGEGDFKASSPLVKFYVELLPLSEMKLNITELNLQGLRLTLPRDIDRLGDRLDALFDNLNAPGDGSGALFESKVYLVRAEKAEVWLDGDSVRYLLVDASGRDILADEIVIRLDAA